MHEVKIDPGNCPLCGNANGCGNSAGLATADCWCVAERFPPELLESIPADYRDRACVCFACLKKFD